MGGRLGRDFCCCGVGGLIAIVDIQAYLKYICKHITFASLYIFYFSI